MRIRRLVGLTMLLLLIAVATSEAVETIPFQVLMRWPFSGFDRPYYAAVKDKAHWEWVCEQHFSLHRDPKPEAPDVDFSRWTLIVLFYGQCDHFGPYIKTIRVLKKHWGLSRRDYLEVEFCRIADIWQGMAQMSSPFEISAIPATDLPVKFTRVLRRE